MSTSGSSPASDAATIPDPPRTAAQVLKDIGLFFASPFITMAYLALFPFIALSKSRQASRLRRDAG